MYIQESRTYYCFVCIQFNFKHPVNRQFNEHKKKVSKQCKQFYISKSTVYISVLIVLLKEIYQDLQTRSRKEKINNVTLL